MKIPCAGKTFFPVLSSDFISAFSTSTISTVCWCHANKIISAYDDEHAQCEKKVGWDKVDGDFEKKLIKFCENYEIFMEIH